MLLTIVCLCGTLIQWGMRKCEKSFLSRLCRVKCAKCADLDHGVVRVLNTLLHPQETHTEKFVLAHIL